MTDSAFSVPLPADFVIRSRLKHMHHDGCGIPVRIFPGGLKEFQTGPPAGCRSQPHAVHAVPLKFFLQGSHIGKDVLSLLHQLLLSDIAVAPAVHHSDAHVFGDIQLQFSQPLYRLQLHIIRHRCHAAPDGLCQSQLHARSHMPLPEHGACRGHGLGKPVLQTQVASHSLHDILIQVGVGVDKSREQIPSLSVLKLDFKFPRLLLYVSSVPHMCNHSVLIEDTSILVYAVQPIHGYDVQVVISFSHCSATSLTSLLV